MCVFCRYERLFSPTDTKDDFKEDLLDILHDTYVFSNFNHNQMTYTVYVLLFQALVVHSHSLSHAWV